jgi:3-dehydroquinate synthase
MLIGRMSMTLHGFKLSYQFPVAFTSGVFDTTNDVFLHSITRLGDRQGHRLLVVVDDGVVQAHPDLLARLKAYVATHATSLRLAAEPVVVTGGEACKQGFGPATAIVSLVNDLGIDRQSFVVAIGGGAVLDMVSFAAAIAHRGVRVVRVPTTTLAQGDSGFAVKNGVNLFGKKNFAGSFVPPFAVINDLDLLESLSDRDRRCGIAEAVKVAVLKDPAFFEWLAEHARGIDAGDRALVATAVQRSADLHLAHICGTGDPFELGSARPLDFGHWAAHKLESMTANAVRHGEAVAIGMALDLRYAVRAGFLSESVADEILTVLDDLGFDLFHPALQSPGRTGALQVVEGLQEFREHLGGELHITLLRGIGAGFEANEMDPVMVEAAIRDLASRATRPQTRAQ